MSYQPPAVTAAGLTIPTYNDILDFLVESFKSTYGQTVYLGNDSADFQMISIFALMISDTLQAIQLAYNNRSPNFAIGEALDSLVKINGLTRRKASFSTCYVTLTGTPGTVITDGVVQDTQGNLWDLPSPVTIPVGGSLTVQVTAEVAGAINALTGTLTGIFTPTAGWTAVTNPSAATPGLPVEPDSFLRARQAISTQKPSLTLLAGTVQAIAEIPGVSRYNILENPTGAVDSNGTPAHSITAVVEGGLDADVAKAIYDNKSLGCYTNGTTSVDIEDPNALSTSTIRFSRPVYSDIHVSIDIHQLTGYSSSFTTGIAAAIANYLNELQIGEQMAISSLYGAALAVMSDLTRPNFSIRGLRAKVGSAPGSGDTSDIDIAYDHVARGNVANVTVNLV